MWKLIVSEFVSVDGVMEARTDELGFADKMNSMPKYVASTMLGELTLIDTQTFESGVAVYTYRPQAR